MAHQQQPQTFVTAPTPPTTRSNYNQTGGRVTGSIQIVCGVASIIFGICMWLVITEVIPDPSIGGGHLVAFLFFGWLSVPIWCGVIFVVSGSLGAAANKDSSCLIGGYMAMCIVSIFFASGQLLYESIAAAITKCYDDTYYNSYNDCPQPQVYYGMHVGSALAASVQIIVAIAGIILCCQGSGSCCGGSSTPTTQQVNVVYTNQPQQQTAGQQVHVVTQPGPYPPAYAPPQQQGNYPSASAPYPQKY